MPIQRSAFFQESTVFWPIKTASFGKIYIISLCIRETFLLLFRKLRNLNLKTVIDSQTRLLKTVDEGPIENGRIKKKICNLCIDMFLREYRNHQDQLSWL